MLVKFKLNGLDVKYDIEPGEFLLDTLKEDVKSLKKGCDGSACGVCTVLLDGKPVLSCSLLTAKCDGHEITTVEGIQDVAEKVAECFGKEGADQCGYCNSAFALIIYALSKEYKNPTDEEIKRFLVGNLCRCTGYQSQFLAVKRYLGGLK
ncbi:MAG: 2Fe-2S iron-sulfur cluster binding domain-containing protein [Bacilli bacterium]|nr:2Fe-2S iron-sulfur cluster binding domain-containing protein [Bacilli bacterium]